jgi:hypothetical protein
MVSVRIYGLKKSNAGELRILEDGTVGIAPTKPKCWCSLMGDGLKVQEGSSVQQLENCSNSSS